MRKQRLLLLLPIGALLLQACGTRLPNSAFVNAQQGGTSDQGVAINAQSADGAATGGAVGGQDATSGTASNGTAGSGATGGSSGGGGATGGSSGGGGAAGANTASDVGVTPTSIKVGNITSIQGQFGPDAFSPSLYGLQAYAASINARGGINGRKLIVDTCDDRGTGDGNLACAQQLVEQDKVFAFLANNTAASARSANYTYTKGVPDLGLPLNNGYEKYPTMFDYYANNGATRDGKTVGVNGKRYQPTGYYRWFKQQRGIDKAAVFFFNIAVSQQQGYAAEADMQAEAIDVAYEGGGSHSGENFAAPSFDTDVVNMKQKGVQGVWDAMDVASNQKLCQAMDRGQFRVTAKVSTIEAWSQKVGTDFSAPCRNSVYSEANSDPYSNKSNPVIARFLDDYAKYEPGRFLHQWEVDGWGMGLEFTHAAESMGPNVTRAGFMKWLNNLNHYTLDGLTRPFDYRPIDFSAPYHDCFAIAHWQDSAQTFVTEAPITTCIDNAKWVSTSPTDDGS